jgi:hypothetical protein
MFKLNNCRRGDGRTLVAVFLLTPLVACANPVIVNPSSLLAFCVVAFWALVIEAGVVALLLAFRGVAPLRVFIAYFIVNAAVFLFLFQPLLEGSKSLPVPVLELLVVLIDGAAIKLLATLNSFQGENYRGVSWLTATIVSCVGNGLSYFVGYIATRQPWETKMLPES